MICGKNLTLKHCKQTTRILPRSNSVNDPNILPSYPKKDAMVKFRSAKNEKMIPEDPNPTTKNAPQRKMNTPEDLKGSLSSRKSSDGERTTKLRRLTVKRSVVYAESLPKKTPNPTKNPRHNSVTKEKRVTIKSEKRTPNVTKFTNNESSVAVKRNTANARKKKQLSHQFPIWQHSKRQRKPRRYTILLKKQNIAVIVEAYR